MENTPTRHADDLPTIFGIFKNAPKSWSVNISSAAGYCPKKYKQFIYQPELRPGILSIARGLYNSRSREGGEPT